MSKVSSAERCVVAILLMVGVTASVGCAGDEQTTVSGKVTVDGRPLDRGVVAFVNALGESSAGISGQIHGDGTYDVQIGQSGQVVAGEYNVTVDARQASVPQPDGAPPLPGELLIPVRYTRIETSGLRFHVRPGTNVIDIALAGDKPADADETAETPAAEVGDQEGGDVTSESDVATEASAPAAEEEVPKSPGAQSR